VKYLLECAGCGHKTPVEAAQAGQQLKCVCGQPLEVPSARRLRELEPIAEAEQRPAATWTARQGVVFLGAAIVIISAIVAAVVIMIRPSAPDRNFMTLDIDRPAIQREVSALLPAEEYRRLEPIVISIPGYAEQLEHGEAAAQLMPCIKLLAEFEGKGAGPMAPNATRELAKRAGERSEAAFERNETRRSLDDWLWVIGIVAIVGILLMGIALILPAKTPRRRVVRSGR
jgi:hypothetical protein